MRSFRASAYNFAPCALQAIDATKGRGVVALRPIRAGDVVALFPGAQTTRAPSDESAQLPMRTWPKRHEADEDLLDDALELVPVSQYAIVTPVLEHGAEGSSRPTGYTYRCIDPMADDAAHSVEMRALLAAYHAVAPFDEPLVPDAMRPLIEHKVEQPYARLMQGPVRILTPSRPPDNPASFEFFLKPTSFRQQTIVLHLPSGAFHPICAKRRAKDRAHVKRRIEQAVLANFDAKRSRLLELRERASALRLPDDYPHLGAFLNEPYASEEANCEFVDPHEWHPRVSRMSTAEHASPQLAPLIAAVKAPQAPGRRDYLQRQLIVATRAIAAGQELLLHYSRDGDGGGTSSNA